MKIEYINKKDDYQKILEMYVFKSEKYRKSMYESFVTTPFTLLLIFVPCSVMIHNYKLLLSFAVGFIAYYIMLITKTKIDRKKNTFRFVDSLDNENLSSEKTIEIVNNKIKFYSNIEKYEIDISQITSILNPDDLIYIRINTQQTFIIPKNGILDGSFDDFFLELKKAFYTTNIDTVARDNKTLYKTIENKQYKKQKDKFEYGLKKRFFFKFVKILIILFLAIIGLVMIIFFDKWSYNKSLIIAYLILLINYVLFYSKLEQLFSKSEKSTHVENYLNAEGVVISDESGMCKIIWNLVKDYEIVKTGIILRLLNDSLWLPNNSLKCGTLGDVKKILKEKLKNV